MPINQSYIYPVSSYHTDANGQLFIHQLLNFLQDAAHQHADGLGFGQMQLMPHNLFWVLSRLSIEISGMPESGDELVLSTWVKSHRGSVSEREFSISINNKDTVKASSLWFCLSGDSHRPTKLPEVYSRLMKARDKHAVAGGTQKVREPDAGFHGSSGTITYAVNSDIDMAKHVNNATYVRWLIDELPPEFLQAKKLSRMDINYLGECFLGEEVFSKHFHQAENDFIHVSRNRLTGKVLLRAFSQWK